MGLASSPGASNGEPPLKSAQDSSEAVPTSRHEHRHQCFCNSLMRLYIVVSINVNTEMSRKRPQNGHFCAGTAHGSQVDTIVTRPAGHSFDLVPVRPPQK